MQPTEQDTSPMARAAAASADGAGGADPASSPLTAQRSPDAPAAADTGALEPSGGRAWPVPALLVPACLLFAAHLLRPGALGPAVACLVWALACFARRAWMRYVCVVSLCLMGCQWFVTAGRLIEIRTMMGLPWVRLACILAGTALVTLAAAAVCWSRFGRRWFCRGRETAVMQAAAFAVALCLLLPAFFRHPPMLLADRIYPGFGAVQILFGGLWAAMVCGLLADRTRAAKTRLRVWLLFSVVFFAQFFLSAMGVSLTSMTGSLHLPVPGVILGGAIYRLTPGFMLFLFLFAVLLTGPAWCSHLCYFGSWDAFAASRRNPARLAHPLRWRALSLALMAACALALRFSGAPASVAVAGGLALGLAMVPVSLFLSRRRGLALYCTAVCPLGLVSCLAGRLSPWRMRATSACTGCGRCLAACRYGALSKETLARGRTGLSCTLCRECELACPRGGMAVSFAGRGLPKDGETLGTAGRVFVCLVSGMHAAFLFMAMV